MTIYISHSTSFDFREELYKPLKEADLGYGLIFPHENNDEQYQTKDLFVSKKCDLVLAEVSFPSTGQGIELGWADVSGLKIICFYRKDSKYSKSLEVISSNFIEYGNSEDLIEKVKNIL